MSLKLDAVQIINNTLRSVLPHNAVKKALKLIDLACKRLYLVAIGKAAWTMAKAASDYLAERLFQGIVITKYDHAKGPIDKVIIYEAGHPIADENTYKATRKVLDLVSNLEKDDLVLFLVSGGGSALFESPLIEIQFLENLNQELLTSGANIQEINTIRKRFSKVKGGRFAKIVEPARIEAVVLSDVLGDHLDIIASGPAYPDSTTIEDVNQIIKKYNLKIDPEIQKILNLEMPRKITNAKHHIVGSVKKLVNQAAVEATKLGYTSLILSDCLDGIAKETGYFLGNVARYYQDKGPIAIICGGETIVEVTGQGKGGRNQEIALAAAEKISGLRNVLIFSVGSDGTDGPTDAAGGIVDGLTKQNLKDQGFEIYEVLQDNDSYHALKAVDGLIKTGATGTNVNDFSVILIK